MNIRTFLATWPVPALLLATLQTTTHAAPPVPVSTESTVTGSPASRVAKDPRLTRGFFVDPNSQAAIAAVGDPRFARIARTPQAVWFTDSTAPVDAVTTTVNEYADRAERAGKTPVVVLYAIPGRDCGLHSAGGYPAQTYRRWVRGVAAGLKGTRSIAILEPDAVASLGDCPGQGDRAGMLRTAVRALADAGAWVYLDAGHSNWQPASVIAERLQRSGVRHARGFVTNVSNYQTTAAETRFGRSVNAALKRRGVPGRRFVIDTSRNGAGSPANNEWCNPASARLGRRPDVARGRAAAAGLDAYLWVKRPGESDGSCNGGPGAGVWWDEGALRLSGY